MELKTGELYVGDTNSRLFKIIEIKKENGKNYVIVENVEPKSGEAKKIITEIETFKRLQLTKIACKNDECVL